MRTAYFNIFLKAVTFVAMVGCTMLFLDTLFNAWYYWNFAAVLLNIAAVALGIPSLLFQLRSAGCWPEYEETHLTWLDRIPLDVYLCAAGFLFLLMNSAYSREEAFLFKLLLITMAGLLVPTLAARQKTGTLVRNNLLYRLGLLLLRWGRRWCSGAARALNAVPVLWGALALGLALSAVDLLFLAMQSELFVVIIWLILRLVLLALAFWVCLDVRELLLCGEKLASGDFSQEVQVKCPLPPLRSHARHLNSIQSGLQTAVDARMQSERLKTELITNVSHDIKTPLTSIVNYVDLLSKTDITDPTAREYISILERQSQRLRKLTEDLIDASKAATGNISVQLAPTDLNVLLTQVYGEYEPRLLEKELHPVFTPAPDSPHIIADGQLLWRIMDNLMGNVCKYAMPGTRVYFTVETAGSHAAITLKNISLYPLSVSGEELTERFVRGDSSRSTEGSGLGLSIASSLTELQKGSFSIVVDGDLFKANLTFPLCPPAAEE